MLRYLLVSVLLTGYANWAFGQFFTKLPSTINSPKVEYAPSISADGNTMIYHSNKDGKHKIYIATRMGESWKSEPLNAINNFNYGRVPAAGAFLSYDGNKVLFQAKYPGSIGAEDIWIVERTNDGWSDPINAGIGINSPGFEGFPSISADGSRIYFMRNAENNPYENKGCYQLYVSEKNAMGVWQAAIPLPTPINLGCENVPRILPDSRTLLFASIRGEQDFPNYDLYMSRLQVDGSWSEPKSLDFLNTSSDDLFGTVPATGATMITSRKENNNYDLFSLRLSSDYKPLTTSIVQGKVTDADNGDPVKAELLIRSQDFPSSYASSNGATGEFTMILAAGSTYAINIAAPGYEDQTSYLDLRNSTGADALPSNFSMKKKPSMTVFNIRNAKTKQPLSATLSINNQEVTDFKNNAYETSLNHGVPYTISIVKPGYESIIDIKTFTADQFQNTLYLNYDLIPLKPKLKLEIVEKGEKIPLANSLFLLYDTQSKKVLYQGVLGDGTFDLELEPNRLYLYKALAQKYFYTEGQIDLRNKEVGGPFPYAVELIPLKVGEKLILNSINFAEGSAELNSQSRQILNNVINVLAQNRNIVIEIAAFTDNVGHAHENKVLSEKRAQAVMQYFLSQQVPQSMISAHGYGHHHHIASNHTEEGRAKNRRVEFIVKEVR
jgi:outer membrane protein OmpA-like peptidoglycan-associated protein